MTSMLPIKVECPSCGAINKFVYYGSISTGILGAGMLESMLEGTLYLRECKACKQQIQLAVNVLLNTPIGMFTIYTGDGPDAIKSLLIEKGLLDDKGEINEPFYDKMSQEEINRETYYLLQSLILNNASIYNESLVYRLKRLAKMILSTKQ